MIEIVEGVGVGAGKSYFTVKRLLDHWRAGGSAHIMDTMHIKWPACKAYVERRWGLLLEDSQYNVFSQDQVTRLFEHTPPGTDDCPLLLVIDECQGSLNARDWNDKSKRDLFDWCTQSRHDNNDLWFISQSSLNIDKQLRRLATYVWRIRNTKQWGTNVITILLGALKYISFGLFTGGFFIVSRLDQDNRTLIGRKQFIEQDPDIFGCYESRSMKGTRRRNGQAVSRLKLSRKQSKRPWVRWAVGAAAIGLCATGCHMVKSAMHREEPKHATETKQPQDKDGKPVAAYDVRAETFRSLIGPHALKTDKFTYRVAQMSPDGLVQAISDGVILIQQPNGRMLYVTTDYSGGPKPDQQAHDRLAVANPTPGQIIIIPDRGVMPPESTLFHDITPYNKGPQPDAPRPTPNAAVLHNNVVIPIIRPTPAS